MTGSHLAPSPFSRRAASRCGWAWFSALALLGAAACGSDDDASASVATQTATPGTPAGSGAGAPSSPGAAQPNPANGANAANAEGNPGLGEQTPLDPSMPSSVDPSGLEVVEIAIPSDLPGCSPAYPHDPAVDPETGLVYYAGSNESCIGQYNPDTGSFQAWPTATPGSYPHGLVVANGVVYFTGQRADLIGSVDPATGQATDYSVAASGPHTPVLHDGAIWFTAQSGGQFGRLDLATGTADVYPFAGAPTGPYGIWPAPDGSLWVALFATNRLARIDTSVTPPVEQQFVLPEANARPRRLAVDADGVVWYTDYPLRALGRLDPALPEGEGVREFPTPGGGRPYGIAVGPDGRVWYNDQEAAEMVGFDPVSLSVVARLPIELEEPGPVRNIAVDQPRRRLWLAISNVGYLAMIQF